MKYFDPQVDGALALAAEAVDELLSRQRAEATVSSLESRLDHREKFFSLVSHDLRNPLAAVMMNAEALRRLPNQTELGQKISVRIVEAVKRADRMISDFLDADRLRSGLKLPILLFPCELRSLLETTLEDLPEICQGRCRLLAPRPVSGSFDSVAIRRAVENLVSNAIKYGGPTSPVTVTLTETNSRVKISVHNSGNPISKKYQETLFQWHSRTPEAVLSGKPGWGLGLMLVKGISEAHGGSVKIESSADQGTVFTIALPKAAN